MDRCQIRRLRIVGLLSLVWERLQWPLEAYIFTVQLRVSTCDNQAELLQFEAGCAVIW